MAIPQSFLDELTARCDIVELVGSYVSLQRKSGRYWGCCPFHNEKTPSFSVQPERQQYYCFGCHKGGGVISFIMEEENLPFPDAVRFLAQRCGMEMPEEQNDQQGYQRRARLLELNKEAARYFHSQLMKPENGEMLGYLTGRKLTKRTITNFGLGAAPEGWDHLIRAMGEKGFSKQELLDAGLAVKSQNGRIYDRFRNRVMFPIIDIRGNVIGFGGRVMDDSTPKYLNSPDTPVFNKSKNLFALNIAKKTKQKRIILTEGYMDTIALHQAGFDCAVASLGTSLTEDHAQLLSRFTKEVVISYDGDSAGVNAAQRAINIFEKTGLRVKVLQIRGAKDPDEFLKKYGAEAFARMLDQSENQMEYRLLQVRGKYNLEEPEDKVRYLTEAAELIAQQPNAVKREVYARRVAEEAKVSYTAIQNEVERARNQRIQKVRRQEERKSMSPAQEIQPEDRALRYQCVRSARAEEGVLSLVLLDASLFAQAGDLEPEEFTSDYLGKAYRLLREQWQTWGEVNLNGLAGELTPPELSRLVSISNRPVSRSNGERALADYIQTIRTEKMKRDKVNGTYDDRTLLAFRDQKANGGTPNE